MWRYCSKHGYPAVVRNTSPGGYKFMQDNDPKHVLNHAKEQMERNSVMRRGEFFMILKYIYEFGWRVAVLFIMSTASEGCCSMIYPT